MKLWAIWILDVRDTSIIKWLGGDSLSKSEPKLVWNPSELRPDIILKVREQFKAAFGADFEQDAFSADFNKHIKWCQKFKNCISGKGFTIIFNYKDILWYFTIFQEVLVMTLQFSTKEANNKKKWKFELRW